MATVERRSVVRDGREVLTTPVWVVGPLHSDGHPFHVHAAGCSDVTRRQVYWETRHDPHLIREIEAGSKREIVEDVYGPAAGSFYEESGYSEEEIANGTAWRGYSGEFKWFPCVTLPDETQEA